MPIEIMSYADPTDALAAWGNSRDLPELPEVAEVCSIDASVAEMPSAMFHFRDMTIFERELFVTPRAHVIWARTSRVDDPVQYRTPSAFSSEWHTANRNEMVRQRDSGVLQDTFRMRLPLCALTSWTARVSFRDFIRMAAYMQNIAGIVGMLNPLVQDRLLATSEEMVEAAGYAYKLSDVVVRAAYVQFKRIDPRPATRLHSLPIEVLGGFTSLTMEMPIALRAQLARHREIMLSDEFVRVLQSASAHTTLIGRLIRVQAVAPNHVWRAVLGKRTCWMAQADLWKPIADKFTQDVSGLPCADGHCPYSEDAKQRLAGNDPGPPCPRYSRLTGQPMRTRAQVDAAEAQAREYADPSAWVEALDWVQVNTRL